LEEIVTDELSQLGIPVQPMAASGDGGKTEDSGGVSFQASLEQIYIANLHLRCASRIIIRVGEFDAVGFDELRRKAAQIPWESYIKPGMDVAIRVTCRKSRLYHSDGVARELVKTISQKLGKPSALVKPSDEAEKPPQLIVVRIVNDHCTVSIDSSGELLHRRGYRLQTAKAPLRETLAAGLILLAGWQPEYPLIDPFCGSGTIPIEAAMIARNIAPGRNRRFGFMGWPIFDKKKYGIILDHARAQERILPLNIFASDRDAGAIEIARANAQRAGVEPAVHLENLPFSAIEAPADRGWLVSNPPYGVRVSPTTDLRNLYSRLGDILRGDFAGWRYGILCADPILAGHMRVKPSRVVELVNGGIGVKYYIGG
jgi:putative N6-adenine-specific DNA methylase